MIKTLEIIISVIFGSCMLSLIAGRFLRVGTEADELEARLMKERQ